LNLTVFTFLDVPYYEPYDSSSESTVALLLIPLHFNAGAFGPPYLH
jgi:hypothetical protein